LFWIENPNVSLSASVATGVNEYFSFAIAEALAVPEICGAVLPGTGAGVGSGVGSGEGCGSGVPGCGIGSGLGVGVGAGAGVGAGCAPLDGGFAGAAAESPLPSPPPHAAKLALTQRIKAKEEKKDRDVRTAPAMCVFLVRSAPRICMEREPWVVEHEQWTQTVAFRRSGREQRYKRSRAITIASSFGNPAIFASEDRRLCVPVSRRVCPSCRSETPLEALRFNACSKQSVK
jgi:hypothetical protein